MATKEYPKGAPCWFELATSDQAAAKQFYGQLFGWPSDDTPMGPGEVYTIFQLNGAPVAAAFTLMPDMVAAGLPPHWDIYFATPDVDASTAKAAELGGQVIKNPFDVMDAGRMSVCKDPGGAAFCLWQAKNHAGVGAFGSNNAVCWVELATWDTQKAKDFYTGLFGWETKGSANMATYLEFSVAGRPSGGLLPMDDNWKGIPSHWGMYVMVADCDRTAEKVKELGGKIRFGPHTAPGVGRLAGLVDPQGAGFSIITLEHPM